MQMAGCFDSRFRGNFAKQTLNSSSLQSGSAAAWRALL
jgi:hypothetical protein